MAPPQKIYLGTIGYGGLAHADFMIALLAFRPACRARAIRLQIDLVGGEALVCRGHAVMMAKFLASEATHLLIVPADQAFNADLVFELTDGGEGIAAGDNGLLWIGRETALRLSAAHPELVAHIEPGANAGVASATMIFDPLIQPETGQYLYDRDALMRRWQNLRPGSGRADG